MAAGLLWQVGNGQVAKDTTQNYKSTAHRKNKGQSEGWKSVVINLTVARKASAPKTDGVTGNWANRTMTRFTIGTPRQILSAWSYHEEMGGACGTHGGQHRSI